MNTWDKYRTSGDQEGFAIYDSSCHTNPSKSTAQFIAELQRAKRASEAPWVRKIGDPSSRENLVMTSAYERPSVQTRGEGERRLTVTHTGN